MTELLARLSIISLIYLLCVATTKSSLKPIFMSGVFIVFFAFWAKVEIERENCAAGDVQACEWVSK